MDMISSGNIAIDSTMGGVTDRLLLIYYLKNRYAEVIKALLPYFQQKDIKEAISMYKKSALPRNDVAAKPDDGLLARYLKYFKKGKS